MRFEVDPVRTVYGCTCTHILLKEGTFPPRRFQPNVDYWFERKYDKQGKRYARVYFDYKEKNDNSEFMNLAPNTFRLHFNTNAGW